MHNILNRLIEKINLAEMSAAPDHNIYLENIFEPAIYHEILARLPAENNYEFIKHPDAVLDDGTITRKLFSLSDDAAINQLNAEDQLFWQQISNVLTSKALQQALVLKFQQRIRERFGNQFPKMRSVPIFYRDYPGYRIGIHTDAPWKVLTMQFYFPKDDSQIHLGTSFHTRENNQFQLLKTNPFKPNSAYAFVRTEQSWHSVQQMASHEAERNSLALTIFMEDNEEYQQAIRTTGEKNYL